MVTLDPPFLCHWFANRRLQLVFLYWSLASLLLLPSSIRLNLCLASCEKHEFWIMWEAYEFWFVDILFWLTFEGVCHYKIGWDWDIYLNLYVCFRYLSFSVNKSKNYVLSHLDLCCLSSRLKTKGEKKKKNLCYAWL